MATAMSTSVINPERRARSIRFFTDEGDHLDPPRGVRSWSLSSWTAISRSVRLALDEWMPDPRTQPTADRFPGFLSPARP